MNIIHNNIIMYNTRSYATIATTGEWNLKNIKKECVWPSSTGNSICCYIYITDAVFYCTQVLMLFSDKNSLLVCCCVYSVCVEAESPHSRRKICFHFFPLLARLPKKWKNTIYDREVYGEYILCSYCTSTPSFSCVYTEYMMMVHTQRRVANTGVWPPVQILKSIHSC